MQKIHFKLLGLFFTLMALGSCGPDSSGFGNSIPTLPAPVTVSPTIPSTPLSSAKQISAFSLPTSISGFSQIDETVTPKVIYVVVPNGTNPNTILVSSATVATSTGATYSAVGANFGSTVPYTVTAQDGSTKTYQVTVVSQPFFTNGNGGPNYFGWALTSFGAVTNLTINNVPTPPTINNPGSIGSFYAKFSMPAFNVYISNNGGGYTSKLDGTSFGAINPSSANNTRIQLGNIINGKFYPANMYTFL